MSSPSSRPPRPSSLKPHLLSALFALPTPHPLHLIVLSAQPKRTTSIFPYASPAIRVWEKEYLLVLSTDLPPQPVAPKSADEVVKPAASATSEVEGPTAEGPTAVPAAPGSPAPRPRRIMISALHVFHYLFPASAPGGTSTSLIYISKADSSGYSPSPLPYTRTLITAFLSFFLSAPKALPHSGAPDAIDRREVGDRILVQLFARAQGQYLFANSAQNPGKRALKGLALCGWWKGVYEAAASDAASSGKTELAYLLPGYEADEAAGLLGKPRRPLPEGLRWDYKPPFSDSIVPPAPAAPGESGLALLIPSLPDDPKTRFLEELVANPEDRIRTLTASSTDSEATAVGEDTGADGQHPVKNGQGTKPVQSRKERSQADNEDQRRRATAILSRLDRAEFWTRMGFRQEMLGDVTGFFTLSHTRTSAPTAGGVGANGDAQAGASSASSLTSTRGDLPLAVYERLHSALTNVDFSTLDLAIEGTEIWNRSTRSIVMSEVGEEGYAACVGSIQPKAGGIPAPQTEVGKRKEEVVTMLQPRKKKKV